MNVLAVIPARGGSRGVPRKNLRMVAGKPLVVWSIEAAQAAKLVNRVIVSTDDAEIADVARRYGAEVHDRPAWAATDDAPIEAALWSVAQGEGHAFDWMVTLQPTCPVREPGVIDEAIKRAVYLGVDAVFTAQTVPKCWLWSEVSCQAWLEMCKWKREGAPLQRQQAKREDLFWMHDGSVCVSAPWTVHRDRMGGEAVPFEVERTVDVDTEADLAVADVLLRARVEVAA